MKKPKDNEENYLDDQSVTLLKAIATGLEKSPAGYEQYFSFEIRGNTISGSLKVSTEKVRS